MPYIRNIVLMLLVMQEVANATPQHQNSLCVHAPVFIKDNVEKGILKKNDNLSFQFNLENPGKLKTVIFQEGLTYSFSIDSQDLHLDFPFEFASMIEPETVGTDSNSHVVSFVFIGKRSGLKMDYIVDQTNDVRAEAHSFYLDCGE